MYCRDELGSIIIESWHLHRTDTSLQSVVFDRACTRLVGADIQRIDSKFCNFASWFVALEEDKTSEDSCISTDCVRSSWPR